MSELLYVGNLPHSASETDIINHFSRIGSVVSVNLKTDRKGRSRCFCFVNMENADEAVSSLDDQELSGRKLRVSKAIPLEPYKPHFERRGGGGHRR